MSHWFTAFVVAATPWADYAIATLISSVAWRIYAILGGVGVLATSLWFANKHRHIIVDVSSPRGPKPTTKKGIKRRLHRIEQFISDKRGQALRQATFVMFYGFLVPSAVLAFAIYFYPWFMHGKEALSLASCPAQLSVRPSPLGTGLFVISQLAMGMMNKVSNFADGSLANLLPRYSPSDSIIAAAVGGYRYFIGLFAAAFIDLIRMAWKIPAIPELVKQQTELEAALKVADH